MILILSGLDGQGKTFLNARKAIELLYRNRKWFNKTGVVRPVMLNLKLSAAVEAEFGLFPNGFIGYWENPLELVELRNCDVIWEEMATHLDATQWQYMPSTFKRWVQQHRHYGLEIYGNTQDLKSIDISVRRMVSGLYVVKKIAGSRSPAATKPPVKHIWGVGLKREVDADSLEKEKTQYKYTGWELFFIDRQGCEIYDTLNETKAGEYPKLRHSVRYCEDESCPIHHRGKVIHA